MDLCSQSRWSSWLAIGPSCMLNPLMHILFHFLLCVPQLDLRGSPFWVRSLRMWPLFNSTIEVVTFRLRGWCMLGVFLLPAFTHLGHECDGMHVCTDYTSVYTLIWKTWSWEGNWVRTHVNSEEKITSTTKILLGGGSNLQCCIKQDSEPNTLPMSYSGPLIFH